MSHRLEIDVPLGDPRIVDAVAGALEVETRSAPARTRVTLTKAHDVLRLRIEAEDARGLRAATNSYLRLVHAAAGVAQAASA